MPQMKKEEIAKFAYRIAAHNERIVVTLKDNTVYSGHFFNNHKLVDKLDNLWNFVIPSKGEEKPQQYVFNGDDIESIKKVQLF
jgi:hypothetical protein